MKKFMQRLGPSAIFGLVVFGTQLLMSLFSLALGGMDENTNIALRIVLAVVFLAGVVVMIYAYVRNAAYTEFNRRQNNAARLRNGEAVTEKMRGKEYVWYKGYVVGAVISIPLIVFTVIGLCVELPALTLISFVLYGCYTLPIYMCFMNFAITLWYQFGAVIIMIALVGVTYHLQGRKMERGLEQKIDSRIKR